MTDGWFGHDRSIRGLRCIAPPTVEPVTLAQAKTHLRLETAFTADDAYVSALITTARQWVETFTRRALCQQTWQLTLERFPAWAGADTDLFYFFWRRGIIDIPKPPVTAINSVSFVQVDGTAGTLTPGVDFKVDLQDAYARLEPVFGNYWPFTRFEMAAATIDFTAGYTNQSGDPTGAIPGPIKQAILLLVGHLYENREAVSAASAREVPKTVEFLCWPYRSLSFTK